ncbi:MAG: NUDIX hydrolase [Gemmatimonadaceae bacterium]
MTDARLRHAHDDLARLARALELRPGARVALAAGERAPRRAAVALVLRVGESGSLELLLIKRAEYEGDPWSGHMALPGGRQEPADTTLAATAMRETLEETAIDLMRDGEMLGTLDEIYPRTPVLPPIVVRPYVFAVAPDVELAPSDEVAAAFWVPVAGLRDPTTTVEAVVVVRGEERRVPSFTHGEHVIWGLTERILRQFIGLLG